MESELRTNLSTGQETIIAFFPEKSEPLQTATSDHPNFATIKRLCEAHDESAYRYFDVAVGINEKFESLNSRYAVRNGKFYKNLDEVHNAISAQVIRFLDAGVDDWKPLVKFMDNVERNPNEDSRNELYDWLLAADLTITDEGMVVGYKCVNVVNDGFTSTVAGPAVVDGAEHTTGYVPNQPGSIVEMARSQVDDDRRQECSVGLHVGTYDYAVWLRSMGSGRKIVEVEFDPADAVSVPRDHNAQKVRVCRYKVIGLKDSAYTGPLRGLEDYRNVEEIEDDPDRPDNF